MALDTLPIDQRRGWHAMWCVIATEFMLFVCMFGSYYYLGTHRHWNNTETPPHLTYAFILLAILLISSLVLGWGERQVKNGSSGTGRAALWATVGMGLIFVVLQCFEYIDHWKTLAPYSDTYGSIFYAITTLHAAHVIAGILMLSYVGILPRYGETRGTPHLVYSTVALYWHFVDFVWIVVVALLYVAPNLQGGAHGY
jgi:heme/copper-type cytochrome/quinol oxidase subunit 3